MLKYLTLLLLLMIISCQQEMRDQRHLEEAWQNDNESYGSWNSSEEETPSSEDEDTSVVTIPEDANNCDWSSDGLDDFSYYHKIFSTGENDTYAGKYNICQSTNDERNIYLQLRNPLSDDICIFPTYNQGGRVTYIGNAICQRISDNRTIYQFVLSKNRSAQYSTYTINGVMIMRNKAYTYAAPYPAAMDAPRAFLLCSNSLTNGISSYCDSFNALGMHINHSF